MGRYGDICYAASRQEVCPPHRVPTRGQPILSDGPEGDWECCTELGGAIRLDIEGDGCHGGTIEKYHLLCGALPSACMSTKHTNTLLLEELCIPLPLTHLPR